MSSNQPNVRYGIESKGPPNKPTETTNPVSLGIPAKRLLREIAATIDSVLAVGWMTFAFSLGYTEDDVGSSHSEPTSKIFKLLLLNAAQYHGDTEEWWQHFLQQLDSYGSADLTSSVQEVYNKWRDTQPQQQTFEKVYPALQSNLSFPSGFESHASSNVQRDDVIEPDRPEISMEINVVAEALDRVSNNSATAEITKWLRDGVPRIIQLERELKSQKALRGIFEGESVDLKKQLTDQRAQIDELTQTVDNLKAENDELKKAKQDDQLHEFDFVTRKEAQDIKEKVRKIEKQRSAPDGDTPETVKEEILKLKKDNNSFKRQIDEIVKVNHSWDEHYRKMKNQLEKQTIELRKEMDTLLPLTNENEQLKTELARLKQDMDNVQKEKDTLLIQAKERIDRAEKEKADKQKEAEVIRQKFDKVQGYARTLTNQRKEAESEISRLNEALTQKMTISQVYHQRSTAAIEKRQSSPVPTQSANPPEEQLYESIPSGVESLIANSLARPQKRVESMSEGELREELELLRQQTDVYRSDFQHERQDRQRIMGELDEMKKELTTHQRELKGQRSQGIGSKQRQLLKDEQYAQQLQRQEDAQMQRPVYKPAQQTVQPRYQPPPPRPQPRPQRHYNYYTVEDIQAMQMPQRGLVPHGGAGGYYYGPSRNYAANDFMVDGGRNEIDGDVEVDGTPDEPEEGSNVGEQQDDNLTCPRCERSFSQDGEFTVHKNRCLSE